MKQNEHFNKDEIEVEDCSLFPDIYQIANIIKCAGYDVSGHDYYKIMRNEFNNFISIYSRVHRRVENKNIFGKVTRWAYRFMGQMGYVRRTKTYIIRVFGRKNIDEMTQLAKQIKANIDINIKLKLVNEGNVYEEFHYDSGS